MNDAKDKKMDPILVTVEPKTLAADPAFARLEELKAAAQERGLSQLEVGRRAGFGKGQLSRIWNGKNPPTDATLDRISAAIFGSVTFQAQARLESGDVFPVTITAPAELVRRALGDAGNDQDADDREA